MYVYIVSPTATTGCRCVRRPGCGRDVQYGVRRMSRAEEFLVAFISVEKRLRAWLDPDRTMSFSTLVDAAARQRPAVRRYRDDLKEFAQLRNAIVHEPGGGHPIADPYPESVQALRRIAALLERPPPLLDVAGAGAGPGGRVETSETDEPVGVAAMRMYAGGFSQLPVYADGRFEGLLTAETVMRWVASGLESGVGLVEEAPVREVLAFSEDPDNHRLVGTDATAFDALALFDEYIARGKTLDAIVITDGGRPDRPPLGIVTVYDVPALHRAVAARPARRRRPRGDSPA